MSGYNWATWEPATRCTGGSTPGALALLAWLYEEFRPPGYSLGVYNCRDIAGSGSLSAHSEGRAVDFGLPVQPNGRGNPIGYDVVDRLGKRGADIGVSFIAFDRTKWSQSSPDGGPYLGIHPHYDHLHIELTRAAGRSLTLTTLRILTKEIPMPPFTRIFDAQYPDRYGTAFAVSRTAFPTSDKVALVTGENWPDGVTASSLGMPLLLVTKTSVPPATAAAIRFYGVRPEDILVVGGPGAVPDAVVEAAQRIAAGA